MLFSGWASVLLRVQFLILILHIRSSRDSFSSFFSRHVEMCFFFSTLLCSPATCFVSSDKLSCCLYNVAAMYRYQCYLVKYTGLGCYCYFICIGTPPETRESARISFFGLVEFIQSDVAFSLRVPMWSDIWRKITLHNDANGDALHTNHDCDKWIKRLNEWTCYFSVRAQPWASFRWRKRPGKTEPNL